MLKQFGPLIKTLSFEAKHCYFKTVFHGSKNRKKYLFDTCKKASDVYVFELHTGFIKHKNPQGIAIQEMVVEALDQSVYNVRKD